MKDELIITLKSNDCASVIMELVTAINKTSSLTALVLPERDTSGFETVGLNSIKI